MRLIAFLLALVAALGGVPAAGGTTTKAAPPLGALLARHVPILVLHPAEQFRPVPVDGFLADSDVMRRSAGAWEKLDGPLPVGGADYRLDQRSCRPIDGVGATTCCASTEAVHGASPVVYGAAFRSRGRIALQYWLWYPYNVYSPTVPPGELWQVHEGDWESVSVILDARGKALLAGYSQHAEGQRRALASVPTFGGRPRVFVALGSHANYFTPGAHRFDPRIVEPVSTSSGAGRSPTCSSGRAARARQASPLRDGSKRRATRPRSGRLQGFSRDRNLR